MTTSVAPATGSAPEHLLVLCTANQCRSAMSAVIVSDLLAGRSPTVEVRSAGFLEPGLPATAEACRTVREHGLDLDAHRSHRCGVDDLRQAELILTMERRHLRQVADLDFDAVRRSFPLREAVALSDGHPRQGGMSEWVAMLDSKRDPLRTLSLDTRDDVSDPTGRSMRLHRQAFDALQHLLMSLVAVAWPATPRVE